MKHTKSFSTQIIAGRFKGKLLEIPNIKTTRASKSIIRGSLFDTLQNEIIGKNFVEVFAGSGSVGLEALSRGANHLFFIEQNPNVFRTLKNNINKLSSQDCTAILGNSFVEFPNLQKKLKSLGIKTYFYIDPPFSIREGMEDIYEQSISLIGHIEPNICQMVIVEHMTTLDLSPKIDSLIKSKERRFGKTTLSYYLPTEP